MTWWSHYKYWEVGFNMHLNLNDTLFPVTGAIINMFPTLSDSQVQCAVLIELGQQLMFEKLDL